MAYIFPELSGAFFEFPQDIDFWVESEVVNCEGAAGGTQVLLGVKCGG